jgi:hypothetical protein
MADYLCHECKKKPGTDVPHQWWCSKASDNSTGTDAPQAQRNARSFTGEGNAKLGENSGCAA